MKIRAAVLDRTQQAAPMRNRARFRSRPSTRRPRSWRSARAHHRRRAMPPDLSIINGDRPRPMPMVLGHGQPASSMNAAPV